MPRFAATALGWTGGWACHPPPKHTWAKPQAGEQGRLAGSRCLRGAGMVAEWPQKCPHGRARPPVSAALVPTRANHGVQPGSSPATRSRGRLNGLCHPPLGSKSSLVPTVEQKAAHPWTGSPHPISPCPRPSPPSPLPDQLVCIPPTQHLAQGPRPQGL